MAEKLNDLQAAVAHNLTDNILLLASAGTGKTKTLAARIAGIIAGGKAKAAEILCLTFTNKACKEMQERIIASGAKNAGDVVVRTFHSFCFDLIKAEAKKNTNFFTDFLIFDEDDCRELLLNLKTGISPAVLLNFCSYLKEARVRFNLCSDDARHDYQEVIKKLSALKDPRLKNICTQQGSFQPALYQRLQAEGADIIQKYDEALHSQHSLDFTDLIVTAYTLLQNPAVKKHWAAKFKYINVDEVQDTSKTDYLIISQLFAANTILLCGDYFQTIYEWRGSKPEEVLAEFTAAYQPVKYIFTENYRTTNNLLQASFAFLQSCFPQKLTEFYPEKIKAYNQHDGEPLLLHAAHDSSDEAWWLYRSLLDLHLKDEEMAKTCILVRSNQYAKELSRHLRSLALSMTEESQRLNFMLVDDFKFFRRQEIKDVLAFLKLALNKYDTTSCKRILRCYAQGIGEKTIAALESEECRKLGIRLTDFLDPAALETGDYFARLLANLALGKIVVFDVESTGVDTAADEIIQIAAIRLNADGSLQDKFMHYVRPTKSVGSSVHTHHLTDEFLRRQGEEPTAVFAAFADFVRDAVIIGHNVSYDLNILQSQMSRLKLKPLPMPVFYDTMDIFRRFYPNLKNHKLEYLGEFCQVTHKSSHDAFDDIMATAEILCYSIKEKILPTKPQREEYMTKYRETFLPFSRKITACMAKIKDLRPAKVADLFILEFGIADKYKAKKELQRVEYLRDLHRSLQAVDQEALSPHDALQQAVKIATLSNSEFETLLQNKKRIPLITVHQSKGLEFDNVFVAGLSDGQFPVYRAIKNKYLEEEARTFYVAITRAKKRLFLSWSQFDSSRRETHISRFIQKIPRKYLVRG